MPVGSKKERKGEGKDAERSWRVGASARERAERKETITAARRRGTSGGAIDADKRARERRRYVQES